MHLDPQVETHSSSAKQRIQRQVTGNQYAAKTAIDVVLLVNPIAMDTVEIA